MGIAIHDKASGRKLFDITHEQLDQLVAVLEEEDEGDQDYYIDAAVCDFLDGKVDAEVVEKLRGLLGDRARPATAAAGPVEQASDDDELPESDVDLENDGLEIFWKEA